MMEDLDADTVVLQHPQLTPVLDPDDLCGECSQFGETSSGICGGNLLFYQDSRQFKIIAQATFLGCICREFIFCLISTTAKFLVSFPTSSFSNHALKPKLLECDLLI